MRNITPVIGSRSRGHEPVLTQATSGSRALAQEVPVGQHVDDLLGERAQRPGARAVVDEDADVQVAVRATQDPCAPPVGDAGQPRHPLIDPGAAGAGDQLGVRQLAQLVQLRSGEEAGVALAGRTAAMLGHRS
jgi:hypothetical protein